jgi:hypothetical protein
VPALPRQTVCPEHGLDHTVGEVVQIKCPANRIWEHPARSTLRLDRVKQEPQRLDDRNDAEVFIILVGFGKEMREATRITKIERTGVNKCASGAVPLSTA